MNCDELHDDYELYALGLAAEPEEIRAGRAPRARLQGLHARASRRAMVSAHGH